MPVLKWIVGLNSALNRRGFPRDAKEHRYLQVYRSLLWEANAGLVLHLGAGPNGRQIEFPFGARVVACDLDFDGLRKNPAPLRVCADAHALPLKCESVDLCGAEHVFEHLAHPEQVMEELARVLKRKGVVVFTTPNKWSYISVLGRITPTWFHSRVKKLCDFPRVDEDTFPTAYRLNTKQAFRAYADKFRVIRWETFVGPPDYTVFLPGLHLLFVLVHWVLRWRIFRMCHIGIVGVLEKCAQAGTARG